jgi:hypothetical protein
MPGKPREGAGKGKRAVVATASILGVLLVLSPLAMSLQPYQEIDRDGVGSLTYTENPSYGWRAALIGTGLLASLCTAVLASLAIARSPTSPHSIQQVSMALTCWAIGWRSYPYWVNGAFGASDLAARGLLDPEALPPMTWIGEAWRLPTLLLYPIAFLASLALSVFGLWTLRRVWRHTYWPWAIIVSSLITLSSLIFCPEYGVWLLD